MHWFCTPAIVGSNPIAGSIGDLMKTKLKTKLDQEKIQGYNQLKEIGLKMDLMKTFGKGALISIGMKTPRSDEFKAANSYNQMKWANEIITKFEGGDTHYIPTNNLTPTQDASVG